MKFNERKFNKIKTVEGLEAFILKIGIDEFPWDVLGSDQATYLTEDFIRKYKDYIYWGELDYSKLSEEFIKEFEDKVDWTEITLTKRDLSLDFIREYKDKLNWVYLSMRDKNDAFFEEFIDYIHWENFMSSKVSEEFIRKYKHKIDWSPYHCNVGNLLSNRSLEFLWEMRDYIKDWNDIFAYNKIPSTFILEHKDYFKSKFKEGQYISFSELSDDILNEFSNNLDWQGVFHKNNFDPEFVLKYICKLEDVAKRLNEIYIDRFIQMMDKLPDNEYTEKIKKVLNMEVDYDYLVENDIFGYINDEDTFYKYYGDKNKYTIRQLMLDSTKTSKSLKESSAITIFKNILELV